MVIFLVIYAFDMHIYTTYSLKLGMDQRREKEAVVISTLDIHTCSASSLERPFLWFMVNDYVLCHQIVTITVIRMKSGPDVPLSFFSMLRNLEAFEISDN